MAQNRRARAARPTNPPRPIVVAPTIRALSCSFCRATLRGTDNYCSHCGMPADPISDKPLFVVEGISNVFNAVFFDSLLEQELNRASRYGHDLSVLVAEIDDLSELEAAYGYDQINDLIRGVAGVMAGAIREPDTLAATNRVTALGTKRFMILLPETPEEGAFRAAEKIRKLVGSSVFDLDGGPSAVTLSMGVASTGPEREEANLVGRATKALIAGRAKGQNRIQVAPAT